MMLPAVIVRAKGAYTRRYQAVFSFNGFIFKVAA
jgi:hypothetical protein